MSLPDYYPPANRTAQWKPNLAGGATFDHVEKLCLHTTETSGWPGYPSFAPHLTYDPWKHQWHQHMPLTKSATTLEDPSSTKLRENRDYVIQVEIVGYCDPKYNVPGKGINYIDDRAVRDLAAFASWLTKYGLELKLADKWLPYPKSYGNSAARMSENEFNAFRGIHGHEHASGNVHGDPGNPPWLNTMLNYAKGNVDPVPKEEEWFIMATGSFIYKRSSADHDVPANKPVTVVVDSVKGWVTVAQGTKANPNDGVDVLGAVVIANNGTTPANVNIWWGLVDTQSGKPDHVLPPRLPVSRTVPAGDSAFGIKDIYKGPIAGVPDGVTRKLRLFVQSDVPVKYVDVQVTGWEMK